MPYFRVSNFSLLLCGTFLLAALRPACANEAVLRPEIGQPLQQAQNALAAHHYNQAIAAVNAAEIISNKTSYEAYTIAQMKAAIAAQTGNVTDAFQALDALIKDPKTSPQEKGKLLSAEISLAYKAKNYEVAAQSAERYLREIGPSEQNSLLLTQALYLSHNWPKTLRAAQKSLETAKKSGKIPSEIQLQLLGQAASHLKDQAHINQAYMLLAKYYPKPEYWRTLIQSLMTDHALSPTLNFALQRLRFLTHNLKDSAELKDMVERSVQLGHATLALNLLESAHKQGLIEQGMTGSEYDRFHNFISLKAQTERNSLPEMVEKARANPEATFFLKAGYNLVLTGQSDQGLSLMREGLDKHPSGAEQALLTYGLAQNDAGKTDEALETLAQLKGTAAADTLAQLWAIALKSGRHQ